MTCYNFEIIIHPTDPEPELRTLADISKPKIWRWPWRINMLAQPKMPVRKYTAAPPRPRKVFGPVDPNAAFRNEQLARPPLRTLYVNKNLYSCKGPKYAARMDKLVEKSWGTIYNYYKKKLRDRKRLRLKRQQKKKQEKKLAGKDSKKWLNERQQFYTKMATPKKIFLPKKIQRKRKALDELLPTIERLASPQERPVIPPRPIGVVSEAALTYEITEQVMKLYTSAPERLKKRPSEPKVPGTVSKAALRAKCMPRIEKLAQPSFSAREARKKEEDMYDPWVISKNALKYKPTPRILELAKPLERE